MRKELGGIIPLLTPRFSWPEVDVCRGLAGISPHEESVWPGCPPARVKNSLMAFAARENNGSLANRLLEETKKGRRGEFIGDQQFQLLPVRRGDYGYEESRTFYVEGDNGFMLADKNLSPGRPHRGACLSFDILNRYLISILGYKGMRKDFFRERDLLIIQLQGTAVTPGKSFILDFCRWEIVLLGLAVDWARFASFPRVLLLPAKYNGYVMKERLPLERARMRYDVTARRCGFKQKSDNEPFIFNFLNLPNPLQV